MIDKGRNLVRATNPFTDADLTAYCTRIGFSGVPRVDRTTLSAIATGHPAAIPFENLDPLIGRPVSLEIADLMAKLVHGGRGGYCFESNGLLYAVLRHIGFSVERLAARVYWNQPDPDAVPPRTHMLLCVTLAEGPVLIDVGFGGAVLTGVLDLVADKVQSTPHEDFRLLYDGTLWEQQIRIGNAWRTTYRFDLTPIETIDCEVANWWTSASPETHFRKQLMVARSVPGKRMALRNFDFAEHAIDGSSARHTIETVSGLCDVLRHRFGLMLSDITALSGRLEQLR